MKKLFLCLLTVCLCSASGFCFAWPGGTFDTPRSNPATDHLFAVGILLAIIVGPFLVAAIGSLIDLIDRHS
jgi:hypothetical protein